MTSTSFNVGLNSATRNSSKVLKPPGGGSSDIFGTTSEPAEPQRKVRNHLTSSIFGEDTVTPAKNKTGNDSFYNLFGSESQSRPVSAVKDKLKSNILFDDLTNPHVVTAKKNLEHKEEPATTNGTSSGDIFGNTEGILQSNGVSTATVSEQTSAKIEDSKTETPPPAVNGASSAAPAVAPAPSAAVAAAPPTAPARAPAAAPTKQRVPPGGFSSGLW